MKLLSNGAKKSLENSSYSFDNLHTLTHFISLANMAAANPKILKSDAPIAGIDELSPKTDKQKDDPGEYLILHSIS